MCLCLCLNLCLYLCLNLNKNYMEHYFHQLGVANFLAIFKDNPALKQLIPTDLLERAIGVIYAPQTELVSHYFHANITKQFDALIYLGNTQALKPLEVNATWHKGEVFETFPTGL